MVCLKDVIVNTLHKDGGGGGGGSDDNNRLTTEFHDHVQKALTIGCWNLSLTAHC
jgi:hypothetical protein